MLVRLSRMQLLQVFRVEIQNDIAIIWYTFLFTWAVPFVLTGVSSQTASGKRGWPTIKASRCCAVDRSLMIIYLNQNRHFNK